MDKYDTWLSDEDIQRLWDVTHGLLPSTFASSDEMEEFLNVVNQAWLRKIGNSPFEKVTIQ